MTDISVFGIRIYLTASSTFPAGISITEFADNADPMDVPTQQVGDAAMGVNGDLISWSKANPLAPVINVIPTGSNDINLAILLEANRASKGKVPARDRVDMIVYFPDGSTTTFINGVITEGMLVNSASSEGRLKTKPYSFKFESKSDTK
jgi:hypothetical protein